MGEKSTIWKWATGLLVLCNIALVATIWLKPMRGEGPKHGGPRDFVIANLKFDAAQVKAYDVLIAAHQDAMKRLRRDAMDVRVQLFGNLDTAGGAGVNADSLGQVLASIQKEIELATYRHFVAVRAICTPAQQVTFDHIIEDVMRKMNGGPRPQGDRPGPPPDGPEGERGPPPPGEQGPPGGPGRP
jgi:protein CpxP